jgi:hypothetical protein
MSLAGGQANWAQAKAATEGIADMGAEEEPDPLFPLVRLAIGRPSHTPGAALPAPTGACVDNGVCEDEAVVLVPYALREASESDRGL